MAQKTIMSTAHRDPERAAIALKHSGNIRITQEVFIRTEKLDRPHGMRGWIDVLVGKIKAKNTHGLR